MTEEAARAADGGLSNASCSVRGVRRDPTRDEADYELGDEASGSVPSGRDGRLVVLYKLVGPPRYSPRCPSKKKSPRAVLSSTRGVDGSLEAVARAVLAST